MSGYPMKPYDGPVAADPWQAKDDANTLLKAEEIKADKPRHKAAKRHARQQLKQLHKVAEVQCDTKAEKNLERGYI